MTKTGEALTYVLEEELTKEKGLRTDQGVPLYIVVFTDGRANDDPVPPADKIRATLVCRQCSRMMQLTTVFYRFFTFRTR